MNYHFSLDFINIIILVYLMIDAPKHGKNSLLWGILGFFFGPIALSIYLFNTGRKVWGWVWLAVALLNVLAIIGMTVFVLHQIGTLRYMILPH